MLPRKKIFQLAESQSSYWEAFGMLVHKVHKSYLEVRRNTKVDVFLQTRNAEKRLLMNDGRDQLRIKNLQISCILKLGLLGSCWDSDHANIARSKSMK